MEEPSTQEQIKTHSVKNLISVRSKHLEDLCLEELAVDFGIEVGLLAHELGEPLETGLAVGHEDGALDEAVPDLARLRGAQPQLAVLQQEAQKTQPILNLSTKNTALARSKPLRTLIQSMNKGKLVEKNEVELKFKYGPSSHTLNTIG